MRYWLILLFVNLLFISNLSGQFYFLEDAHEQIEVEFLKKKIEVDANSSFFNVLKIKNPSDRSLTFQTNFSYPADWTFMGEKKQRITLAPNDSVFLPFRAATSINAKGDIGYAIVASLSDMKGKTFKNEYSFVNVPKIQDIIFTPMNRVEYIDQLKNAASIKLFMANNGNTEEEFYIDFILSQALEIPGTKENYFHDEYILLPYTDTIVEIPVFLNKNLAHDEQFHRITLKASTVDTTINTSIWLKKLSGIYNNEMPSSYKMLSAELGVQNLFSKYDPIYIINIRGNFLFKKYGSIFYKIQSLNAEFYNDPWKFGRYLLKYRNKKLKVELGDVAGYYYQNVYGRGGITNYQFGKNVIEVMGTKSVFVDKQSIGFTYKRLIKSGAIGAGYSVVDDKSIKAESGLGFIKGRYSTKKIGSITGNVGMSMTKWKFGEPTEQIGYGGELNYNGNFKNTIVELKARYANREYSGNYHGRLNTIASVRYILKNRSNITANYFYNLNSPPKYFEGNLLSPIVSRNNNFKLLYNRLYKNNIFLTMGPITEERYSNSFYGQTYPYEFKTRNAQAFVNARFKNAKFTNQYFGFYAKGGMNFVTHFDELLDNKNIKNKNWFAMELGGSYRGKYWGTYVNYYHGPVTVAHQFNYAVRNYFPRNVRIMPYIEYPIVPGLLYFDSQLNYIYDIAAQSTRLNLTSDITAYLNNTWRIILSNTIGNTSTVDNITEEKFSFTSTYFEFRIKKDFIFKQPRYQYYKLDLYFFKDLNGNRVKDEDEPGIKDIMVEVNKDDKRILEEEYNTTGHFMPTELLSDITGHVQYKNIPNGFYHLEYYPITEIKGAYSSEQSYQNLYMGKNEKIYIPFVENNKIFGKVLLNRSKLSNLGQIDVGNIKVTAEDTYGRKFSTLTDGKGEFTIYVPNVDKYKVRVNNIFFENFDLEQNGYEVQLNGYKQFEINFIFNEKRRKINFSSSYEYGSTLDKGGIEIVRRTNLSGKVKDATTLKPVVAEIAIIDKEGNEITTAKSSLKTGIFMTSFVAGDDYSVEVNAEDYWFYAEDLFSQQIVTFKNLKKDVLLKAITVGQLIPMKTLNFEAGSSDIPPTSFPELERLLKVLKRNPAVKIAVMGHADDLEILDSKKDLALERAKLVAKYLIANGYNRVKYIGHANTKPIADNDTEDGRRLNRRVEIVVSGK